MRTTSLLLLSSIVALPALAQDQAPPIRFFLEGGFGQSNQRFNGSGDKTGADFEVTSLRSGVSYDFAQIGDLGIGADLLFQAATIKVDDVKSGFKPQNVGVMVHLEAPRYGMRVGYMQDLGNDAEYSATASTVTPNTDGLNSIHLGANAQTFFTPNLRVFGDAQYIVTMDGEAVRAFQPATNLTRTQRIDTNTGDWFVGMAGVGFRATPSFEVGAKFGYNYQTAADDNSPSYPGEASGQKSSNFSVMPFVTFNQPMSPLTFYAELRNDMEYAPVGYSLSGNNSIMGKTGAVVGLKYSFRADNTGR